MSLLTRQAFEIPKEALATVDRSFEKQTRLDLKDLPESMEDSVWDMKELCLKNITPTGVFRSVPIEKVQGEELLLTSGHTLRGGVVSLVFERSFELVFYAATLKGFTELMDSCDDITDKYFLDAWGTAFVEAAGNWLHKEFSCQLEEHKVFLSNYWSPGQHNFPLENQPVIFDLLKPEEIGLQMTERFMMHPTKSISSIIGIMKEKDERNLFPCDFCPRRETCHTAYGGSCHDPK